MTNSKNPLHVVRHVLHHAQNSEDAKHKRVAVLGLSPQMTRLREFQSQRIARTYEDFAAQPQYAPAMQFFLEDLYAPRDFTQRDYDAERAYNFLQRFVPAEMLKMVTDARELIYLSYGLDEALLHVLVEELNFKETLTAAQYAEAYRRCDNYAARERQIELLVKVLRDAADTARFPLSGAVMKMVRGPAHKAGWHEMYGFLERGHEAFRKVRHHEKFLQAIRERELEIMRQIRANDPNPFQVR